MNKNVWKRKDKSVFLSLKHVYIDVISHVVRSTGEKSVASNVILNELILYFSKYDNIYYKLRIERYLLYTISSQSWHTN